MKFNLFSSCLFIFMIFNVCVVLNHFCISNNISILIFNKYMHTIIGNNNVSCIKKFKN